jgi:hypothetical protein
MYQWDPRWWRCEQRALSKSADGAQASSLENQICSLKHVLEGGADRVAVVSHTAEEERVGVHYGVSITFWLIEFRIICNIMKRFRSGKEFR